MSQIAREEKLSEFLSEFASDECSRELLQLLGRHPCTRLSRLAIRHALDWRKADIERALCDLIGKNLVKTCVENGIALYWLTEAEPYNSLVRGIVALDWSQWHNLVRRMPEFFGKYIS